MLDTPGNGRLLSVRVEVFPDAATSSRDNLQKRILIFFRCAHKKSKKAVVAGAVNPGGWRTQHKGVVAHKSDVVGGFIRL